MVSLLEECEGGWGVLIRKVHPAATHSEVGVSNESYSLLT